jgi:hypothetical protein
MAMAASRGSDGGRGNRRRWLWRRGGWCYKSGGGDEAEAEAEMKRILEGRNRPTGRQELIHLPLYILFFVIIMVRLNCHFGSRESKHSEITRSCSHLPTVG